MKPLIVGGYQHKGQSRESSECKRIRDHSRNPRFGPLVSSCDSKSHRYTPEGFSLRRFEHEANAKAEDHSGLGARALL